MIEKRCMRRIVGVMIARSRRRKGLVGGETGFGVEGVLCVGEGGVE